MDHVLEKIDIDTLTWLINRYKPRMYLHNNELYYPTNIEFILDHSRLVDHDKVVMDHDITSEVLFMYNESFYTGQTGLTDIYLDFDAAALSEACKKVDINAIPIYTTCKLVNDKLRITYIFLYSYNGAKNVVGCYPVGAHNGDVEHVTLEFAFLSDSISDPKNNYKFTQMYYGAHTSTEGEWVDAINVNFEDGHPVVYVAQNSHASYNYKGTIMRYGGFGNDTTNNGIKWDPTPILLHDRFSPYFNPSRDGWLYFAGRIGKDGVSCICDKDYFNYVDSSISSYHVKVPMQCCNIM